MEEPTYLLVFTSFLQRPWRSPTHLLVFTSFLSLLSDISQHYCPEMEPSPVGRALPHQALTKKMPYRLATGNLMVTFSQSTFLSPDGSSLCQSEKKINRRDRLSIWNSFQSLITNLPCSLDRL